MCALQKIETAGGKLKQMPGYKAGDGLSTFTVWFSPSCSFSLTYFYISSMQNAE